MLHAPREPRMPYDEALERSADVARAEFTRARSTLREAEKVVTELEAELAAVPSASGRGAATEAAADTLARLGETLNTSIAAAMEATRRSLEQKERRLSRFTVTLFGRTMAGKSTIREALTLGDGSTIGSGAQRTTRDIREYEWQRLRVVDTPGIGAYAGESDRELALSAIDESDLLLFLASSDGVQEESFEGMKALRKQNKPVVFVLNVKLDLSRRVYLKRFLRDPAAYLSVAATLGHRDRLRRLACDWLGMRNIVIVAVHAQAAYLATTTEHADRRDELWRASGFDELLQMLSREIESRGPIRRLQTMVDGTRHHVASLQATLDEQGQLVQSSALYLKGKFGELESWLDRHVSTVHARIEDRTRALLRPLRDGISCFVDENIERADVSCRWGARVEALGIEAWTGRQEELLLDEVRSRLEEFQREVSVEMDVIPGFTGGCVETFDPMDVKRGFQRASAGAGALWGVAELAALIGGANFWNPVGLIAGIAAAGFLLVSWLLRSREKKLQREKARAAEQLRRQVDELERAVADHVKKWFERSVVKGVVRDVRGDTVQLYSGMFRLADALSRGAGRCAEIVEDLDRHLLIRCAGLVGHSVKDSVIGNVARDPGAGAKFIWKDGAHAPALSQAVGRALEEPVLGIGLGARPAMIAAALAPGRVHPAAVSLSENIAFVSVSAEEAGRARGQHDRNVRLASRLLGVDINIQVRERS